MKIEEIVGQDGQTRCKVCGAVTRLPLKMPLFDGKGGTTEITVRVMCKCQEKAAAEEKARIQHEEDMKAIERLKKMSLIDAKLENATFSNYLVTNENRKAYEAAVRYVAKFDEMYANSQGILLYGPVGTGKSYTAAAIANELLRRKHSVVMTSFIKLLKNAGGFGDEEYISRLNRAKLLIIDDLGAERNTDTALERVYNIVDSRYRSGKPLILTTNLTMAQIKEETDIRYIRIYDRIIEMCYPLRLGGLSWRKQDAASRFLQMKKLLEG